MLQTPRGKERYLLWLKRPLKCLSKCLQQTRNPCKQTNAYAPVVKIIWLAFAPGSSEKVSPSLECPNSVLFFLSPSDHTGVQALRWDESGWGQSPEKSTCDQRAGDLRQPDLEGGKVRSREWKEEEGNRRFNQSGLVVKEQILDTNAQWSFLSNRFINMLGG